jgi:hypothetical protein
MFALASVRFSTSAQTITFTDIPQNYTHLQIRYGLAQSAPGTGPTTFPIRFNSDSTTGNYKNHQLLGDGASASANAGFTTTSNIMQGRYALNQDFIQAAGIVDILDYTSTTKVKTIRSFGGFDTNGAGTVALSSGIYSPGLSTTPAPTAITSITTFITTYSFYGNGIISLYGIKAG